MQGFAICKQIVKFLYHDSMDVMFLRSIWYDSYVLPTCIDFLPGNSCDWLAFVLSKVVVEKRQLLKLGVKNLLMAKFVSFKERGRQSC